MPEGPGQQLEEMSSFFSEAGASQCIIEFCMHFLLN